jgi:hypothetical protein
MNTSKTVEVPHVLPDSDEQLFNDLQKVIKDRKMEMGVALSTLISLCAAGVASLDSEPAELRVILELVDRLSEQYMARKNMMDTTGMQKQ